MINTTLQKSIVDYTATLQFNQPMGKFETALNDVHEDVFKLAAVHAFMALACSDDKDEDARAFEEHVLLDKSRIKEIAERIKSLELISKMTGALAELPEETSQGDATATEGEAPRGKELDPEDKGILFGINMAILTFATYAYLEESLGGDVASLRQQPVDPGTPPSGA